MPQNSLSENPILSQNTTKILDVSRDALAKMVGVDSGDLPDGEFFRVIDGQIDNLRRVATAHSGSERREEMRKYLQSISDQEAKSRILDQAAVATEKLENAMVLGTEAATKEAIESFTTDMARSGIEGIETLGALGSAKSVDEMTASVDKLTQTSKNIAANYGTMTNLFGKSVSGLMKVSGLDKLFNALKRLFGFGSDDSDNTPSSKPSESPETKGGTPETSPANTPETPSVNIQKMSPEKIAEDIGNQLWRQYVGSGWITNPETQKKAFFETFNKYAPEFVSVYQNLLSNAQDANKEWNIFDELVKYPLLATKFLLALIARGVISEKAIMLNMYDAGRATLGVYLLSPFTLIQNGPSQVLQDFGALDASQLGALDTVEKQTMISILSHTMAPQLFLAGKLTSTLSRLLLLGMYWDQGTGFTKAKSSMNVVQGELQKGINSVDDIFRMLGTNTRTIGLSDYTTAISNIANQAKEMALVAEVFRDGERNGKTPSQIAQLIETTLSQKGIPYAGDSDLSRLLNQLKVAPDLVGAKLNITSYLTNVGSNQSGLGRFVGQVRNMFNPMSTAPSQLEYFIDDARLSLKNYGTGLAEVVKNHNMLGFNAMKKAGLALSQAELIDAIEKGHLPIKAANAEDARGILQQILKTVPKGMEHVFAGLTVVLTIAHVSQAPADQKAMTALLDTAAMWPVIGGLILMHEGFTLQGSQPVRLGYLAGGGLVTALGVREMTALVSRYGWVGGTGRALATPATMVIDSIGAGVRGSQYLYQMARFGPRGSLGVLGASRGLTVAERIRPTGLLAMGALISLFVLNEIFEKQTRQVLLSAGILKEDGSIDSQHLKEGWKKVPKDEQKKILDIVLASFEESDLNIKYDSSENRIVVHTPKVVNGLPVPENLFDSLRKVFHDTGIKEPKIFLSENALATTRQYINSLPVSPEQKKQLFIKFNIHV